MIKIKLNTLKKALASLGVDLEEEGDGNISIKFPDSIPKDLLTLADKNPEISGFVYPENENKVRAGIYKGKKLVGFFTPREERGDLGWRVGAIFIHPDERGSGIAAKVLKKFFKDRVAAPVPISVDNISSRKSFERAGFKDTGKEIVEDDGWVATWFVK